MSWPKPGDPAVNGPPIRPGDAGSGRLETSRPSGMPEGAPDRFRHLRRLTDDTGLIEHAVGCIPRRKEGYSTDDQSRALWICLEWLDLAETERERALLLELADTYLSFLLWVQREDGLFHNNIDYARRPEPETPSDDCFGRALWAAAFAWTRFGGDPARRIAAETILREALPRVPDVKAPRGVAYALAAMSLLAGRGWPSPPTGWIRECLDRLKALYRAHARPDWRWFEPALTYSNGILPWGLLWAHEATGDREALAVALESLAFLAGIMTGRGGVIRPVGNDGWCSPARRSDFDQQPVDVLKLAMACGKAAELTDDERWRDVLARCRDWFHGRNDHGLPLYDNGTGGCRDGLEKDGVNLNQGAESTLSYLGTEMVYRKLSMRRALTPRF